MRPTEIDLCLQRHTPVECVPLHGEFVDLEAIGHRFLLAMDGLWIEVRRAWCHLILPVALDCTVPKPFGTLVPLVETAVRAVPEDLLGPFCRAALAESPNEMAAVVIRNNLTGQLRLHNCETVRAGVGHLSAVWPKLMEDESIVVDMHSHGPLAPFFSSTDIADTGSEVVIAGVIGGLGTEQPTMRFELFACCLRVPLATLILDKWGNVVRAAEAGDFDTTKIPVIAGPDELDMAFAECIVF